MSVLIVDSTELDKRAAERTVGYRSRSKPLRSHTLPKLRVVVEEGRRYDPSTVQRMHQKMRDVQRGLELDLVRQVLG